ncbi:uncharacterized protein B0I36DRAFT_321887 [Microdochium trichocladiopsis]|uniref:Uncharacterized protein n=1 Tax=Microdochium trichocladiopsis TaxID=1682393 RepID=A0A9P9BSF7_9PEZI|nr:uncharacterized protein B0I36DRAFT_321887 [Microdochium trichocladiopsis]KAH7033688.1 hypothetical protein B0I36DRAFT_321887 [Microdochium trichocladiopsis]
MRRHGSLSLAGAPVSPAAQLGFMLNTNSLYSCVSYTCHMTSPRRLTGSASARWWKLRGCADVYAWLHVDRELFEPVRSGRLRAMVRHLQQHVLIMDEDAERLLATPSSVVCRHKWCRNARKNTSVVLAGTLGLLPPVMIATMPGMRTLCRLCLGQPAGQRRYSEGIVCGCSRVCLANAQRCSSHGASHVPFGPNVCRRSTRGGNKHQSALLDRGSWPCTRLTVASGVVLTMPHCPHCPAATSPDAGQYSLRILPCQTRASL